jgi:cyanophycinase
MTRRSCLPTIALLVFGALGCDSRAPGSTGSETTQGGNALQVATCRFDPAAVAANPRLTYNANPEGTLFIAGGGIVGAEVETNLYAIFAELVLRESEYDLVNLPAAQADATDEDEGDANREEIWSYTNEKLELLGVGASNLHPPGTTDEEQFEAAQEDAFLARIRDATAIWLPGGSQSRLARAYVGEEAGLVNPRDPADFVHTPATTELYALLKRGGVIGGSSAGASIQADFLEGGGRFDYGLGLLRNAAIDQHLDMRLRQHDHADAEANFVNNRHILGLGLSEDTGILVEDQCFSVHGASYVWVWDYTPDDDRRDIYVLPAGAKFDMLRRRLVDNGETGLVPVELGDADVVEYGGEGPNGGSFEVLSQGGIESLVVRGDAALAVPIDGYEVTENTVLQVEFEGTRGNMGLFHAIGLVSAPESVDHRRLVSLYDSVHEAAELADTNDEEDFDNDEIIGMSYNADAINKYRRYFSGTNVANVDQRETTNPLPAAHQILQIPLGSHYAERGLLGTIDHLFVISEAGGGAEGVVTRYRNIRIFERSTN